MPRNLSASPTVLERLDNDNGEKVPRQKAKHHSARVSRSLVHFLAVPPHDYVAKLSTSSFCGKVNNTTKIFFLYFPLLNLGVRSQEFNSRKFVYK